MNLKLLTVKNVFLAGVWLIAGNPVLTIVSPGKIQRILFALIFCIREAADQVNLKLLTRNNVFLAGVWLII